MRLQMRFASLDRWPGVPTADRKRSQFKSTYDQTLRLLEYEIDMLEGSHVVIQLDCDDRQIRRDGSPKADARTRGPGVVLAFESKNGPVSFPCDQFTTWQDNLRGIALALEALRAIDRYGVTRQAEQYRGWLALPAPNQTRDEAMAKVYELAAVPRSFTIETARRNALKRCHPDQNGGDQKLWNELHAALEAAGI